MTKATTLHSPPTPLPVATGRLLPRTGLTSSYADLRSTSGDHATRCIDYVQ
ncbi:hypothetical protein I6A60_37315 [Frankia sp. AgB1.9]|uniref:hypothetical protein n=1 Tax=unclassified Frankia TaxID=2632575 RepID=UPI001932887E|nr:MULTISPECIES: hypothetical protein [unclassified Frankia]MBL7493546.1 hypothetical protein [Frankia sp. AgW1.1]MBL7553462.1 hypothetical protein [Frankia sp. AgB1.9]MBL7622315.1 hypothetical protein [Frankia sp. AgB1.8]